jgi:uncharacterized protein YeaO (DUF488 family)
VSPQRRKPAELARAADFVSKVIVRRSGAQHLALVHPRAIANTKTRSKKSSAGLPLFALDVRPWRGNYAEAVAPPIGTIGVYGWTLDAFLDALRGANVGVVLDVRQRRGVRGSEYAWANAARLEAALAEAGIGYRHHKELAPTTELRQLQYAEDESQGVGKRSRQQLAPEYRRRYREEILDKVDLVAVADNLPPASAAVLLCVERDAEACHRSLIGEQLARDGHRVFHLRPNDP